MKKIVALCFLLCLVLEAQSQFFNRKVLFVGNSYTYYNNLPNMIANIATSIGDTLDFDSYTPGGYTFQLHSADANTIQKINAKPWHYVVLQEQSQLPSFPWSQVQNSVFAFAKILDSLIKKNNQCSRTIFYNTWGRKNGDASNCASWPPVCTYLGMDSMLTLRYKWLADSNKALISPVASVWKHIRSIDTTIDLYQSDESHPSLAGSYAAACCFYTTIFQKNPLNIITNEGLPTSVANTIKQAVKTIVFDSLSKWNIDRFNPIANFTVSQNNLQITVQNISFPTSNTIWLWGDGTNSMDSNSNVSHTYATTGIYKIQCIASNCFLTDTQTIVLPVFATPIENQNKINYLISPNPFSTTLKIGASKAHIFDVRIINMYGKIVLEKEINSSQSVETNLLPNGIYILELRQNKQLVYQQKIAK